MMNHPQPRDPFGGVFAVVVIVLSAGTMIILGPEGIAAVWATIKSAVGM